jgi:hypothetical protein
MQMILLRHLKAGFGKRRSDKPNNADALALG